MTNTTNTERLKPCPFCGHDRPSFERLGTERQSCIVACGNCGARHESSDEHEHSGASWNTRAALAEAEGQAVPSARALIEECRDALGEELTAWDIDPPLHHVKQAHDKCVAWLAAAPEAPAAQAPKVQECNDTDSPWLVCETCNAVGKCAQPVPAAPTVAEPVALWWRHRITDQVGVVLADYVIPEELDAKWFVVRPLTFADHPPAPREPLTDRERLTQPRHSCEWKASDDIETDAWNTGCGQSFVFMDGGPKENSAEWCQYCGGRLNIGTDREGG